MGGEKFEVIRVIMGELIISTTRCNVKLVIDDKIYYKLEGNGGETHT